MLKKLIFTTYLLAVFFGHALLADPQGASKNYWRNTNYNSHYVLYDYASKSYIETINCKVAYRFSLVSNTMNQLILFDASRGMTVLLNYEGMFLKEKGAANFTFYQKGTFDSRVQFSHSLPSGQPTGTMTKQHACGWVEYLHGSHQANFRFNEISRSASAVDLYDPSRDMLVRLENSQMLLRQGSAPLAFFRKGHW